MRLVAPDAAYRESFLEAMHEFKVEGLSWWSGPVLELAERDFGAFVALKRAEAKHGSPAGPPKTHLWAIDDGEFVGRIAIFHHLTDALRSKGGHIGYDTRPSRRRRGFATEMLRQAIPVARDLGLSEVLITCDETNLASARVIERNGGVLIEERALDPERPPKLYFKLRTAPT